MFALLTFDLADASSAQRTAVYEYLETKQWKRIDLPTTAFYAGFKVELTADQVRTTTKADMDAATKAARVKQYVAVVHVGPEKPVRFQ